MGSWRSSSSLREDGVTVQEDGDFAEVGDPAVQCLSCNIDANNRACSPPRGGSNNVKESVMLVTHLRCKLSQGQRTSGRRFERWKLREKAISAEHARILGMRVFEVTR